jgi:hypothetical protein
MREGFITDLKDGEYFSATLPVEKDFHQVLGGYSTEILSRAGNHMTVAVGSYVLVYNVFQPKRDAYPGTLLVTSGQKGTIFETYAEVPRDQRMKSTTSRVNHDTGTDPEIFVVHGPEEEVLPAFKFLPPQEDERARTKDPRTAYAYRDGFAAEFYTQPGSCHGYLVDRIRDGLRHVQKAAQKCDKTAKLTIRNTVMIPETVMAEAKDDEIALGCTPSENAYGDFPHLELDARSLLSRSAGGHVHLGLPHLSDADIVSIVKGCDIIAGIPAVAMFEALDTPVRRQTYGRAGEYRRPKYGLEYRVLSNAWMAVPEVAHLTLNLVRIGAKVGRAKLTDAFDISEDRVREIINSCDVVGARKFVADNLDTLSILLRNEGLPSSDSGKKAFTEVIQGGLPALFPDFENLDKNWLLNGDYIAHSHNSYKTWSALCGRQK